MGIGTEKNTWKCQICGYLHIGESAPESCPICAASTSEFELYIEEALKIIENIQNWRCLNCEYIHVGDNPPDICPICGVAKENFEPYINKNSTILNNSKKSRIIILGAGIAGVSAAEEIRKNSVHTKITIISSEIELPYYRLNLTRYLAGVVSKEELSIHPKEWYATNNIDLICGKIAVDIDVVNCIITLDDSTTLEYDKLIIALGAHSFIPPSEGVYIKNVTSLRTVEDADFILENIKNIDSCICIGGGILGLEAAGAIAKRGIKVTLIEGSQWLMPRQLNEKAALLLQKHLKSVGIEVIKNARLKEIKGSESCQGIIVEDGREFETKLVLITAGVRPNTYIPRKIGLNVDKGLVTDNYLKTSDSKIFAAGDVTEHNGNLYGLWNVAQYQGKIAGLNAIGMEVQFGGVPRSNILKVMDIDLFSIGDFIPVDGSYQLLEKEEEDKYSLFVQRDGKIVGSVIMGNKALALKVKQAVENNVDFPGGLYDTADKIIDRLMNGAVI